MSGEWRKQGQGRPRWVLHLQATFWRVLMKLGIFFHKFAPPQPPNPNFTRQVPTTCAGKSGYITLHFYLPPNHKPSDSRPVVINFHGGGFTLGSATDDARWCATVVTECKAVVVSVDYRLAPECPFPTAVEDGVDAVRWVHANAAELGINPNKIALSGFSSGGNMAFTVPIRLYHEQTGFRMETHKEARVELRSSGGHSTASSTTRVDETGIAEEILPKPSVTRDEPVINLACIVPWYPSLDYTRSREQRRATNVRKDQELPAVFTDLFDDSYLHPPNTIALDSPYLSPGVASAELLKNALPETIIMHTCEFDMLLDEGKDFEKRLTQELGKTVHYHMVPGVPHGWDKAPNPLKPTPGVREHYLRACKLMNQVFAE
ncbi:alpha/beta-hydrolase [Piedraia hortae CBS 480.64]|uniref:Alpha/beta-hydrolase n=1 Tax=Piedraia hortae CBS 480.64 TaxID=1314780 RepID=A0A6A7BZ77_9PEZI|nr:alpha/beta-hydrolase [Piedraia hortae CBS 480.64]